MQEEELFPMVDNEELSVDAEGGGAVRVHGPERKQVEWLATDLDSLIPEEHPARIVWAFVERQDLGALYAEIRARTHTRGRDAIDPRILLALWLKATLDGVGSAREVARRCEEDVVYRWICGGVSVNYHTLSDFRVDHMEWLDEALTRNVASLLEAGLVTMQRVAQDGVRVRASAGAASYRRRPRLEQYLEEARHQVTILKKETEGDGAVGTRRQKAARERAARERVQRLERALEKMKELECEDERKPPSRKKGPERRRVSTTDPEVVPMKMADGGFRPAANVQLATDTTTQLITAVDVSLVGSDHGLMPSMIDQHQERYGQIPAEILVDGGFAKGEDIEYVSQPEKGCTVYSPPYTTTNKSLDPYTPRPDDSPAVAQWRIRMATPEAKKIYHERAATAECVNAIARNRRLWFITVRGLRKMKAFVLWYVLAHNLMRTCRLKMTAG